MKKTTEQFVNEARNIHGDKYDYSKVEYKGNKIKVCIICPEHGEFWQVPKSHLKGCGCAMCSGLKSNRELFIKKARKVHGDKYDYSKVEYKNAYTKVCIICPIHGEFWQLPYNHLSGANCAACSGKKKYTISEFIAKSRKIHGDKYDYSKVEYKNIDTKVCIICPIHGEFWQAPNEHLHGYGCEKCGRMKMWDTRGRLSKIEFVERSIKIHNNKYDYSKVECKNVRTKVCIICPKHGEFWQTPRGHLRGCGCPKCRNSWLERHVEKILNEEKIQFEKEITFEWLKNDKDKHLYLDFYLPEYKIAIECQGVQHFIPIKNNIEKYQKICQNDKIKRDVCKSHNINLVYFSNEVIATNYTKDNVIYNKNDLIKEIKNAIF